ncbi:MAG TPA: manganese efflux pump MntP family protein [Candidatus Hydrogenedentes bacterium]|nr:manganese efflux pump MntP family protein [Candidatus Hydrogenedentota bacterium]HRT19796.1 manganese efflux pump MntP family protein [Candidatus Hydrogenedentota bacterium]HRT64569.1 manganese efflux pump MntP family protein [Candidatus Hydrogenedentota bacterium]
MSLWVVLGIAVGLAMDTLAVAIGASVMLRGVTRRQVFRFAFHFGLFQAIMPVIGWAAGIRFVGYIAHWDHWIAFALLGFVGGKAIAGAWAEDEEETPAAPRADPTRGWSLIVLSVATSIDALAVGLSFAVLDMAIWVPVAIIGVVTALITMTGMLVGSRLGSRFGKRIEIMGGLILIGIGVKILIQHLVQG